MSQLYHLVIRKYRNQKAYLLRYSLVPCIFQGYAVRPGKQTWVFVYWWILVMCFQCCSQSLVCSATFHCNGVSGWASTPPPQLITWGVFELFRSPRDLILKNTDWKLLAAWKILIASLSWVKIFDSVFSLPAFQWSSAITIIWFSNMFL